MLGYLQKMSNHKYAISRINLARLHFSLNCPPIAKRYLGSQDHSWKFLHTHDTQ